MRLSSYVLGSFGLALSASEMFMCPLPKCKCPSVERSTAPAVGFALEIGYGTASVKFNNGTIMPVTRIAGSSQYIQLMQNLATSPIRRMFDGSRTPPGVDQNDISTRNIWVWFKIKCWVRKLFFLPATPEIGILADMVSLLRRDVEAVLGQRVKSAALASPDRVSLTSYEIGDVFDCLWMEDLMADKNDPMFDQLYSMAAASAGNGDGLCLKYTDAYACGREEDSFQNIWDSPAGL